MRQILDALSDFDLRFIVQDFKEKNLKKGVASKKLLQEWNVTAVADVERVHAIVDEVYGA
jgi:hypothetical protein